MPAELGTLGSDHGTGIGGVDGGAGAGYIIRSLYSHTATSALAVQVDHPQLYFLFIYSLIHGTSFLYPWTSLCTLERIVVAQLESQWDKVNVGPRNPAPPAWSLPGSGHPETWSPQWDVWVTFYQISPGDGTGGFPCVCVPVGSAHFPTSWPRNSLGAQSARSPISRLSFLPLPAALSATGDNHGFLLSLAVANLISIRARNPCRSAKLEILLKHIVRSDEGKKGEKKKKPENKTQNPETEIGHRRADVD